MKYKFWLILLLWAIQLPAQEIVLQGKVTDSLQQPLPFANIMAENLQAQSPPVFAMTDENGHYRLSLLKKYAYQISVLYMGYQPVRFKIDSLPDAGLVKNIVLKLQQNQLDEIVITADIPVKVQEDTIIYKANKFTTGEERKLKDLLKKLPGMEVDKNGKITVMGKQVSSVLVEGKAFFGGGTKLAVDNIPADAVDKVVAIDDYNSIGFMKGLTDEQKMILNIKLKEGKKHFVFGDVEAGVGNDQHYLAKANLFYYSPKTNLSYIGNLNDAGESPMTLNDFIRFESSLMDMEKLKSSFQNFKDISNIIMPGNFLSKQDNFHALQWQQDFGQKIEWSTYVIYADNQTGFRQVDNRTYLITDLTEERENQKTQESQSKLGKIHFRYKKNIFNYLDFDLYVKNLQSTTTDNIFSNFDQDQNQILQHEDNENFSLKTYLGWHHQINKNHTIRWQNTFNYNHYTPEENWQTNYATFNPLLPLQNDSLYTIRQNMEKENREWNTELKHYWILNTKQHVYFTLGNHWSKQDFATQTWQDLSSGEIHPFTGDDFDNNLQLSLNDAFGGIQYKLKLWKSIFKLGIFAHYATWNFDGDAKLWDDLFYWSPEFSFEKKVKYTRNISFKYRLKNNVFSASKYAARYYLTGYNTVAKGNISIRNELSHHFSFSFRDFSIANNYQYYINISYQQKTDPVSNKIVYQDISSFSMPVVLQTPSHSWRTNMLVKRDFKKMYIKLLPVVQYNIYQQYIQDELSDMKLFSQQYQLGLGSYFQKYPNFDTGAKFVWTDYYLNDVKNQTKKISPYLEISYDFSKAYIFKFNYELTISYDYQNNQNTYQTADFSLLYQKDNQPWGFEISATNLFDNTSIKTYNQSNILLIENNIYTQPRVLLFKLHYKL